MESISLLKIICLGHCVKHSNAVDPYALSFVRKYASVID